MPTELIVVALALLQGLAEFLPISSSGHLALGQSIFGLTEPEVAFTIVLHLATLLAVVIFYRQTIWELICELKYLPALLKGGLPRLRGLYASRPNFRFICLICVASLPTGIIGLSLQDLFVSLSSSTLAVGLALMFTGCVLKVSARKSGDTGRDISEMTVKDALLIGLMQGLAITPGISRSGMTIATALLRGLRRDLAAKFSFILSIPAIVGALIIEMLGGVESSFSLVEFALGFAVAAISGYLALTLLVFIINRNSFGKFAYYCWAVGLAAVLWSLLA
ncbi:MAG: undecaprenyl-diphosphate phosphatase [Desulfovibrionaceae bacterium]|nr:undecaprenyl-diphosphate phosphatase [Desulfovibrionaceae bacterium]